jgi:hypothetical protein
MDNIGYKQMSHMGSEGMSLNIKNTQDRFELFMIGIQFLQENDKKYLIELVKDYVPQYQKLNPYALALGFLVFSNDRIITKAGLILSDEIRKKSVNFESVPLSEIVAGYDILRYARLYDNISKKNEFQPMPNQRGGDDYDDSYDEINYDDDYDEENKQWSNDGYESDGFTPTIDCDVNDYHINFNETFNTNYDLNLKKINKVVLSTSGKHSIFHENAKKFVSKQSSELRRKTAKNLIGNTIYITLKEIDEIIKELVLKVYMEDTVKDAKCILWYCGKKDKSSYFLSVLALKHIRILGLQEPIFTDSISNIGGYPYIILDDVSYSGIQMEGQLNEIYKKAIDDGQPTPNVHLLLIALNEFSLKKLSFVKTIVKPIELDSEEYHKLLKIEIGDNKKSSVVTRITNEFVGKIQRELNYYKTKNYKYEYITSPFKIHYLEGRLYPSLLDKLGLKEYVHLLFMFSPWTLIHFTPMVSIYLDHKIADINSTFTTTLTYGPIVPDSHVENFSDLISELYDEGIITTSGINKILNSVNQPNVDMDYIIKIIDEFKSIDKIDKPNTGLSFYPLITNCSNELDLVVSQLEYLEFMVPNGCVDAETDCEIGDDEYQINYYLQKLVDNKSIKITKELNKKIHGNKCPSSWYKKGDYQME